MVPSGFEREEIMAVFCSEESMTEPSSTADRRWQPWVRNKERMYTHKEIPNTHTHTHTHHHGYKQKLSWQGEKVTNQQTISVS